MVLLTLTLCDERKKEDDVNDKGRRREKHVDHENEKASRRKSRRRKEELQNFFSLLIKSSLGKDEVTHSMTCINTESRVRRDFLTHDSGSPQKIERARKMQGSRDDNNDFIFRG